MAGDVLERDRPTTERHEVAPLEINGVVRNQAAAPKFRAPAKGPTAVFVQRLVRIGRVDRAFVELTVGFGLFVAATTDQHDVESLLAQFQGQNDPRGAGADDADLTRKLIDVELRWLDDHCTFLTAG